MIRMSAVCITLLLAVGCVAASDLEHYDFPPDVSLLLAPEEKAPEKAPPDKKAPEKAPPDKKGHVSAGTAIMFNIGIREIDTKDWEENAWLDVGLMGVHVFENSGFGIDCYLLDVGYYDYHTYPDEHSYLFPPFTYARDEAYLRGVECSIGVRYLWRHNVSADWFLRAGPVYNNFNYDYHLVSFSPPYSLRVRGSGGGWGANFGGGLLCAYGGFRFEIGANFGIVKSTMRFTTDEGTPFGLATISRETKELDTGARPVFYMGIGFAF